MPVSVGLGPGCCEEAADRFSVSVSPRALFHSSPSRSLSRGWLLSVTGKPSCLRPQFSHRVIKSLAGVGKLAVKGQGVNTLGFAGHMFLVRFFVFCFTTL